MSDPVVTLNASLEGRYRIEREIGAGGMATVFLAEDLRHNRQVALKVLKSELAAVIGPDRFRREIQIVASLTHPNILPLHDSGEAGGFLYYVMPYVEGESLRDRIDRERQLPVDEAVSIATSMAQALQAAHDAGVIHRDIKPENVLLIGGQPLISDFGIALAVGKAVGERLTETGLSLGTPYYMSPEQATGDHGVGPATDIYSVACVLYEMLIGDPPFMGSTAQAVLGQIILGKTVSASGVRSTVPPHVDAVIRRGLEQVPADRFRTPRELAEALADPAFRHRAGDEPGATEPQPLMWRLVSAVSTTVAAVLLVVVVGDFGPGGTSVGTIRARIDLFSDDSQIFGGAEATWGRPSSRQIAFSPDGTALAYVLRPDNGLFLRILSEDEPTRVPGSDLAGEPIFSPDGEWLAFWSIGEGLRRFSTTTGEVQTVMASSEARLGLSFAWGDNDTIYGIGGRTLYSVPASGGDMGVVFSDEPERPNEVGSFAAPSVLPGSDVVLFHELDASRNPQLDKIVAYDRTVGATRTVLENGSSPQYLSTGHLLFARMGTLMAVAFDRELREVVGEPVQVIDDVMHSVFMPNTLFDAHTAQFAVSEAGHLAYVGGGVTPPVPMRVVRLTLPADTVDLELDPWQFDRMRVSPSGDRIAFSTGQQGHHELRVHDLTTGQTRLLRTGDLFDANYLSWSPDGRSIAFVGYAPEGGAPRIFRVMVDAGQSPEEIQGLDRPRRVFSWSVDDHLMYQDLSGNLWVLPPDGSPIRLMPDSDPFSVVEGTFSPDAEWIAYRRVGEGVYLRPYPGPGEEKLVGGDAGQPVWDPDGDGLFYISQSDPRQLWRVDLTFSGGEVVPSRPTLAAPAWSDDSTPVRAYDIFPDGSFLQRVWEEYWHSPGTEIQLVVNFADDLERRTGN